MALGWGIQEWGLDYWGSVEPLRDTGFGDFQFRVLAMSQGYTIRITLTTPEPIDSPRWSRRFLILRKRAEWPQSVDDVDVEVISDVVEPAGDVEYKYFDEDLISGENYYYRLFLLGTDGLWYSSRAEMDSAYPYSRWGCARSMYMSLPRGWRSHDITADLRNTIEMYGALADNLKTDFEYLRSLFSISEVHEDLIPIADSKIGWPTWLQAGGIHKRLDSEVAVETYKRLGTEFGYSQLIESVTDWELTVTHGWRYIIWSNTEYCTTPDLSSAELIRDLNGPNDNLRYVNDASRWQSFTGLGFYLTEIPGVTGPFTQDMWDRIQFLIEWGMACYVVYQVRVVPIVEEQYPIDGVIDESDFPLIAHIERSDNTSVEDENYRSRAPGVSLFYSTNELSLTNSNTDRVFHRHLEFSPPYNEVIMYRFGGDEEVHTEQTGVVIECLNALVSQGSGRVELRSEPTGSGTNVIQTIESWDDEEVIISIVPGTLI